MCLVPREDYVSQGADRRETLGVFRASGIRVVCAKVDFSGECGHMACFSCRACHLLLAMAQRLRGWELNSVRQPSMLNLNGTWWAPGRSKRTSFRLGGVICRKGPLRELRSANMRMRLHCKISRPWSLIIFCPLSNWMTARPRGGLQMLMIAPQGSQPARGTWLHAYHHLCVWGDPASVFACRPRVLVRASRRKSGESRESWCGINQAYIHESRK